MIFLPLHGTFFLIRGVGTCSFFTPCRVGVTGGFVCVFSALVRPGGPAGVIGRLGGVLVDSEIVLAVSGSTSPGAGVAMFASFNFRNRSTLLCLRVSVLERGLGCCLDDCREENAGW